MKIIDKSNQLPIPLLDVCDGVVFRFESYDSLNYFMKVYDSINDTHVIVNLTNNEIMQYDSEFINGENVIVYKSELILKF